MDYVQLLRIGRAIWAKNVDRNAKKWKRPPKSSKNKMFVFGLCSTSDDRPMIWAKNVDQNAKKWKMPPKLLQKKCLFLDYVQLLMIGWVIWAKKLEKNEKGPLSHRKIKCLFLDYVQLLMIGQVIWANNIDRSTKQWKRPPKSLKNKMFVFGLRSTSDDRPSNLSKKCWPKHKKMKKAP